MNKSARLHAFERLGAEIASMDTAVKKTLAQKAQNENPWFTESNVLLALEGIERMLSGASLKKWLSGYTAEAEKPVVVGIAMAGNIPLVGFHDALCVLVSGHFLRIKPSSQDSVLIKEVLRMLCTIEPQFEKYFSFEERMNGVDAMIATGSDNTARYFEFYFKNIPHIIRKNRTSCAVIIGEEPEDELSRLGHDVFSYFGLGCRNVSKLYAPDDFDLVLLLKSWEAFRENIDHHKYANNYDYQKSILLMNGRPFLDGGYFLLMESPELVSPVSVIYYEKFKGQEDLRTRVGAHREKLQVIASAKGWYPGSVPFGATQFPEIGDYADNVDTMEFLDGLG